MIKLTNFKSAKLRYQIEGSGPVLVFLHGYLESLEVWNGFIQRFTDKYTVISVDIPGHGESGIITAGHSMDLMAEAIKYVLDKEGVDKCVLFGHSMGGYVTMAFVSLFPDKLHAFSLVHSTPFADNEEKRANRDREIVLVREGKKDVLFNTNIAKEFANDNLQKLDKELKRIQGYARKTPEEGIIALLNGMKERTDKFEVLEKTELPFLWILGKKDNYIPYDVVKDKVLNLNKPVLLTLESSGHIGFVEEPDACFKGIDVFLTEVFSKND